MLTLRVAVGKVSKLETPELKSDLEKAAKTAEDKAEVSTLSCHPFCFLHFHVNAALPVCGSHVPEQLMQIKHILRQGIITLTSHHSPADQGLILLCS